MQATAAAILVIFKLNNFLKDNVKVYKSFLIAFEIQEKKKILSFIALPRAQLK